jgi:hypothetical protein
MIIRCHVARCSLFASLTFACAQGTTARPAPSLACSPRHQFAGLGATTICPDFVTVAETHVNDLSIQASLFAPNTDTLRYLVTVVEGGIVGHAAFVTGVWRAMCQRLQCGLLHLLVDVPTDPPRPQLEDPVRDATRGSGLGLVQILDSLAMRTGRGELRTIKLVPFGFSAAGSFALTFSALYPDRVIGFVRYHSNLRGLTIDTARLATIPGLLIVGELDSTAGVDDTRRLWVTGRQLDAPWTFAIEPGRAHVSLDGWLSASDLIWRWIEAVSLSPPRTNANSRRPWMGNTLTGAIVPITDYTGASAGTSWLPDSATAAAWQRLIKGNTR